MNNDIENLNKRIDELNKELSDLYKIQRTHSIKVATLKEDLYELDSIANKIITRTEMEVFTGKVKNQVLSILEKHIKIRIPKGTIFYAYYEDKYLYWRTKDKNASRFSDYKFKKYLTNIKPYSDDKYKKLIPKAK